MIKFPLPTLDFTIIPILVFWMMMMSFLEYKFQLRRRVQTQFKRMLVNGSISVISFGLIRLMFIPVMLWIARLNENWHFGLNYLYDLPALLEGIIAFVLLDYANYWWHILNHFTFLWRFHNVHHTDPDLDVSTGLRFHFGEIFAAVIYRGAAVLLTGASPFLVLMYELFYEAAVAFHHSNTHIPVKTERLINRIFVMPRMHGVHHSIVERETNSNYAVIFSFGDRLHHTTKFNVPQQDIIMGVPAYRDPKELTFFSLLKMPFAKQRKWLSPDGSAPERPEKGNAGADQLVG